MMQLYVVVFSRLLLYLLLEESINKNVVVFGFSSSSIVISTTRYKGHYQKRLCLSSTPTDDASDDGGCGLSDFEDRLKYLKEQYLSGEQPPEFPTFNTNKRPNKADVYDTDELANLLELHGRLYPQTVPAEELAAAPPTEDSSDDADPMNFLPSLHELVLQTVEAIDNDVDLGIHGDGDGISKSDDYAWFTDAIKQKIPKITVIASDVDGTLLGAGLFVHPKTKMAATKAIEEAAFSKSSTITTFNNKRLIQHFLPATGKTRAGAIHSLGPELGAAISKCPGVFIQGLYCVDSNNKVIFEKRLAVEAIEAAEELVAESGTSIVAYDGDSLYTTEVTQDVIDLHEVHGEPLPKAIPTIAGHEPGVHKILICADDLDKLTNIVRPKLEELAKANSATVTQALPNMLELLPVGCSKASGLSKLCEVLDVDPSKQLLAIGDAENDVEMLEMASIGVCVGNGSNVAKDAADIVLEETNDEGGAGIAIDLVMGGL